MNNHAYDVKCRAIWREETTALDEAEPLLKLADERTHRAFLEAILRIRCEDKVRFVFIYVFGFGVGFAFGYALEWPLSLAACIAWLVLYVEFGTKGLMLARYRTNAHATRRAVECLRAAVETGEQIKQGEVTR